MSEDKIKIELTRSEALVLFEIFARFSNDEKLEIQNLAEEQVLYIICCALENVLDEPFAENYDELVAEAREDVIKKNLASQDQDAAGIFFS